MKEKVMVSVSISMYCVLQPREIVYKAFISKQRTELYMEETVITHKPLHRELYIKKDVEGDNKKDKGIKERRQFDISGIELVRQVHHRSVFCLSEDIIYNSS
jgi:hypothetical protein